MGVFSADAQSTYDSAIDRATSFADELHVGQATSDKQREAGQEVVQAAKTGISQSLEAYGREVEVQVKECGERIEGVCERFGDVARDGEYVSE